MTDSSDTEDTAEAPLSLRLREGTRTLHVTAERTGIMAKLLRGNVDRPGY